MLQSSWEGGDKYLDAALQCHSKHVPTCSLSKARAEHPALHATSQKNITMALSFLPPWKNTCARQKETFCLNKTVIKLFQAGLEKCYQCHKLSLLKFATFWQYRAGKHRIIFGTAYTYSLSSGPIFLHLIASRCWHFTDCWANPLFFTPP